jgi:endonuclease YncB( thermonuclease family)
MTKMRFAVFLLLLLAIPLIQAETLSGRVVRVTDGDTIVVLDFSNVQHKIRLTGIDAPERRQAYGTKSKEHLSDLVAGKTVVVDYSKYDRYQRILGKVLVNGEDVNLEQVEAGMAWHYKKYQGEQSSSNRVKYSDAELEARRHKLGLWNDPSPSHRSRPGSTDRRGGNI